MRRESLPSKRGTRACLHSTSCSLGPRGPWPVWGRAAVLGAWRRLCIPRALQASLFLGLIGPTRLPVPHPAFIQPFSLHFVGTMSRRLGLAPCSATPNKM